MGDSKEKSKEKDVVLVRKLMSVKAVPVLKLQDTYYYIKSLLK
jgi:hypothetical protein